MAERGCKGVWLEILHLNYRQIAHMRPWQKDAIGEPIMARARKRNIAPELWDGIWNAYALADGYDMPYFSKGLPYPSEFANIMRGPYEHSFPVLQDFVNWCYAHKSDGETVTVDEFVDVLTPGLPKSKLKLHHYLGATAHDLWWTHNIPTDMTYGDLFRIMWAEPRTSQCPASMYCFAYAGSKGAPVVDANGLPLMVFDSRWFGTLYAEGDD